MGMHSSADRVTGRCSRPQHSEASLHRPHKVAAATARRQLPQPWLRASMRPCRPHEATCPRRKEIELSLVPVLNVCNTAIRRGGEMMLHKIPHTASFTKLDAKHAFCVVLDQ